LIAIIIALPIMINNNNKYLLEGLAILILNIIGLILYLISCCGFFTIEPNTAIVIIYYGKYVGTIKKQGFYWINPFYSKQRVSLKSKNLLSKVIKVNDKTENPIMMGCCVVWRIQDTSKSIFDVQDYYNYVSIKSEIAIRYIGCMFPY
jgi:regulator of protease activity HflC (stomatin/prohibitin superfamily)